MLDFSNNENVLRWDDNIPDDKLIVQKSQPLMSLWRSDMTLSEFKILDSYLARIDTHNPEKRTVIFSKGDIEKMCGVKKINKADLMRRIKHLGCLVDIETNDKRIDSIALFQRISGYQDETGQWTISLTCTEDALKYIFNIESIGYQRYKLRSVRYMNSKYTYFLFLHLERNRFRKTWTISVDELRYLLKCDSDHSYDKFKEFNRRILKACQKEIHEKTECRFSYEPIRIGRFVKMIRFTLEELKGVDVPKPMSNSIAIENAIEIEYINVEDDKGKPTFSPPLSDPSNPLNFLASACTPDNSTECEFSEKEMQEIQTILTCIDQSKFPPKYANEDIEVQWYHYLTLKYNAMNQRAEKYPIKKRYAYLKRMLMKDTEQ